MPAKHSARSTSPGLSQFFLSFTAVLLAVLTAWVAARAAGPAPVSRQPTVVLPSMPQVPMGWSKASFAPHAPGVASPSSSPGVSPTSGLPTSPTPAPAAPPAPGAPAVPGAPPAPGVPPAPGTQPAPGTHPAPGTPPAPPKTTKPAPPPSPPHTSAPPPARDAVTVVVDIYSSWEQGYTTGAKLTNSGDDTVNWTVRISHSGQQNLSLVNYWNANGRQSGDTFIFTGTLSPGASVWWGWQAGKTGRGNAHPDGCTLVGGKCTMR